VVVADQPVKYYPAYSKDPASRSQSGSVKRSRGTTDNLTHSVHLPSAAPVHTVETMSAAPVHTVETMSAARDAGDVRSNYVLEIQYLFSKKNIIIISFG